MSTFTPILMILCVLIMLMGVMEYIHLYGAIQIASDQIESAVLQTATSNAYNAYKGVREGNSSAHQYVGNQVWTELVSTKDLMNAMEKTMKLKRSGNTLTKETNGKFRYSFTDIEVHATNVKVGTSGNLEKLTIHTRMTVTVPVRFMGLEIMVKKKITLKSYFTPRF